MTLAAPQPQSSLFQEQHYLLSHSVQDRVLIRTALPIFIPYIQSHQVLLTLLSKYYLNPSLTLSITSPGKHPMVVQNIEKFSNDSFIFFLCFFLKVFFFFFLVWTIFEVFNEFVKILLLLFMFCFFWT